VGGWPFFKSQNLIVVVAKNATHVEFYSSFVEFLNHLASQIIAWYQIFWKVKWLTQIVMNVMKFNIEAKNIIVWYSQESFWKFWCIEFMEKRNSLKIAKAIMQKKHLKWPNAKMYQSFSPFIFCILKYIIDINTINLRETESESLDSNSSDIFKDFFSIEKYKLRLRFILKF
jgi:hypothetical protein